MKQRVEGPLAKALLECVDRLFHASRAVDNAKFQGAQEQAFYGMEIEAQLLKSHQAAEARLVQALDEAQMAAAEAHEGTVVPTEAKSAEEESNFLVKSSESCLADREKEAKEAHDAHEAALAASECAIEDFACRMSFATMESRINYANGLQHVADEKKKASFAAASAMNAAADEVAVLRKSQNEAREAAAPARPIEELVYEELTVCSNGLQLRRDKEGSILQEVGRVVSGDRIFGRRPPSQLVGGDQDVMRPRCLARLLLKGGALSSPTRE
jgi:hypothetical protein